MGYSACWGGVIKFTEKPCAKQLEDLDKALYVDYFDEDRLEISVGNDSKYYEDEVISTLKSIEDITKSGEIEFRGSDDDSQWRFLFKDGEWVEESGYVYYESELPVMIQDKQEFIGQIIDIFQDALDNPHGDTIEGRWYDTLAYDLETLMKHWKVFK